MSSPGQPTRQSSYPRLGGSHMNHGNDPSTYSPLSPSQGAPNLMYQPAAQQQSQHPQYRLQRTMSMPGAGRFIINYLWQ